MKTILLALATLSASSSAFAAPDTTFYCHGIHGDEGKTLYVKLLSPDDIREGEKMEFLLVVRDGSETLFSGHVKGESEDVMLSFKSSSPKLDAMIYMDEYDQTWVKLGRGKDMRFDCSPRE